MNFEATYFDGRDTRGRPVQAAVNDDHSVSLRGEGTTIDVPAGRFEITPPLGSVPWFLALPEGRLEAPRCAASDEALSPFRKTARGWGVVERWLDAHFSVALAATVLLVTGLLVVFVGGLPRMAHRIAFAVPESIERGAGRASRKALAQLIVSSPHGSDREQMARQQLNRLSRTTPLHIQPEILFIRLGRPNAFALPGGTIVVTEELINSDLTDDEIAAVLAHELGHEELRHGLQSVLRNSSALIIVSLLTGDLSTLTTFSGTLPAVLLTRGYSREFESEADAYAVGLLQAAKIDPDALAVALEKIEHRYGDKKSLQSSYLSTHPPSSERIAIIRAAADRSLVPSDYFRLVALANRARHAHEYPTSIAEFRRAFKLKSPSGRDLYNAGCSAALAGDSTTAFDWLGRAVKQGWTDASLLGSDEDLAGIRSDSRWKPLAAEAKAAQDRAEAHYDKPLQAELLQILTDDQSYVKFLGELRQRQRAKSGETADLVRQTDALKAANIAKIEQILDHKGWPGPDQVGARASTVPFRVIQHANPEMENKYLPLMRAAAAEKKAEPASLALLEDRVAVREKRGQIYGSQVRRNELTGKWTLEPIEDPSHVDVRRAEMGMVPLAQYLKPLGIEWPAAEETGAGGRPRGP